MAKSLFFLSSYIYILDPKSEKNIIKQIRSHHIALSSTQLEEQEGAHGPDINLGIIFHKLTVISLSFLDVYNCRNEFSNLSAWIGSINKINFVQASNFVLIQGSIANFVMIINM